MVFFAIVRSFVGAGSTRDVEGVDLHGHHDLRRKRVFGSVKIGDE